MTFPLKGSDNQDYTALTASEVTALFTAQNAKIDSITTAMGLNNTKTDATNTKLDSLIADVTPALIVPSGSEYEYCAASSTNVLGATGATGDDLDYIVVFPTSTTVGAITLKDGTTSMVIFAGGTRSSIVPFTIPIGLKSKNGAWSLVTLTGATCLAVGNFS